MVGELDYSSCEKESCAPNMMASSLLISFKFLLTFLSWMSTIQNQVNLILIIINVLILPKINTF